MASSNQSAPQDSVTGSAGALTSKPEISAGHPIAKAFLPHQRVTIEGKAMGMLRLSPEEAVIQMTASGLMDELDALIDKYKIDKAARRLSGDRTWLVASESIYGEFCGDTLTHAVHIFVLSYEANKNSLFV